MVVSMASACALYFLSSPTRKEIDEAHARGRSFDIGVLSLRNLRSFKKKILFGLLILSSLPIHLFSNSVIYGSNPEVDYDVVIASPEFLTQPSVDCSQDVAAICLERDNNTRSCETHPLSVTTPQDTTNLCNTSTILHEGFLQNKLLRLDTTECLTAYSTPTNPSLNYGNLLVVTKNQPLFTNNTVLLAFHHMTYSSVLSGHGWTCGPDDPLPGQTITMTEPVISTVKDAVSSFQGRTDAVTSNRNFIHRNSAWKSKDGLLILEPEVEGITRNFRWFHGASLPLWIATLFFSTVLLAIPIILLTTATVPIPQPYSIGFGSYAPLAIAKVFSWSSNSYTPLHKITNTQLFPTVLLANIPQFAISVLLFLFAQVYTRYNPLGILISLVFGGMMLVTLMATGSWRLSGGQLVGSGSMEIAAACKGK
ncbi:hypothetical protein EYC84_002009 [Monilinia fructicola]|uniref:DUF6536 domain-containing protein n=1 Tax=Monilinia fructicola TaxID=38448 RepID=A0A5M9JRF3_MONFR|nr:hypothetical protein EYC84_002009 [Monilinia fructicola]